MTGSNFQMLKSRLSILGAAAASLMLASSVAQAGSHSVPKLPCDTAQLIVPWKAGGGTQVLYALVEKTISEMDTPYNLKVITVPGQGGNKGAKQAAKAAPDGCTLFAIHQSAITSFLNGRIDFHYNGFDTIANVTVTPDIIGASADAPFNTIQEMAAYAKANPGKVTAGATFGSTSHFIWLLLEKTLGIKLNLVPYDGTAERMNALLSGAITLGAVNVASGKKHLQAGTIKPLAIAADDRDKAIPDVPTLKEAGYDMTFALERGIVAPKGTPREVIDMWAGIIKQAVDNPSLQAAMDAKGTGLRFQGPDEFRAYADKIYSDYEAVAIEIGMYKK
ncbi:MAG: tripartite tricarboxylate transporter substrate binding protein [Alphaproteobacteria bacterium]|jgi:tripartite-type tricarboxylate transporter receptor subunit TctC|nr:tripartite tricarboxylate transporter substrate binding protein [Alphaproteobacteria bacterium]